MVAGYPRSGVQREATLAGRLAETKKTAEYFYWAAGLGLKPRGCDWAATCGA